MKTKLDRSELDVCRRFCQRTAATERIPKIVVSRNWTRHWINSRRTELNWKNLDHWFLKRIRRLESPRLRTELEPRLEDSWRRLKTEELDPRLSKNKTEPLRRQSLKNQTCTLSIAPFILRNVSRRYWFPPRYCLVILNSWCSDWYFLLINIVMRRSGVSDARVTLFN